MSVKAVERKLAAILAADLVGFSRMMGNDEAGTLAALKDCRARQIDPAIKVHHGRIFKTTGDGLLAEFASVVDAVQCALVIQGAMAERAAKPDGSRLVLRLAVNLGDVMIDGDDVYGDGVNVAARLEPLAQPGGVVVSEKVKAECAGKLVVRFTDAGQHSLKNITLPVRVFHVEAGGVNAPATRQRIARRWRRPAAAALLIVLAGIGAWQSGFLSSGTGRSAKFDAASSRLSVMVLPFATLGGDSSQDWFADGVTENITASLSQIPDSFVIARSTAFAYKGKSVDPRQVGRDIGIRYILQGSVLRAGARMRVNAALISTETGGQIWTDSFDYNVLDMLDLESQIAARIARALDIKMTQAESRRAGLERPNDPNAMDLTMQGQVILNRSSISRAELDEARALFLRALERDDKIWSAWLGVAQSYLMRIRSIVTSAEALAQAEHAVARAQALAPDNARVEYARGGVLMQQGKVEGAISALERAISLDRNFAPAYALLGTVKALNGRPEASFSDVEQAIRLSPLDPRIGSWYFFIGASHINLGQFEAAVTVLEKSVAADPAARTNLLMLAAALAQAGRLEEARAMMRKFLALEPGMTLSRFKARELSRNRVFLQQRQRAYDGMLKAGLPE